MPLPVPKTSHLWMRVLNKDCWDVVLLHFTDAEWKLNFRLTGESFMTLYSPKSSSFCVLLCYLYVTAYAQYFPVSVFNPIKCLMSSQSDYKRNKPPLYNPIEVLANSIRLTWLHVTQVELYCSSATCGWNETSCLTGPRCYINTTMK